MNAINTDTNTNPPSKITTTTTIQNSSDIITLNVGGTHYTTCVTTLTKYSTYFQAMFSNNWNTLCCDGDNDNDDDNCGDDSNLTNVPAAPTADITHKSPIIFIDKDPIAFQYILNYMREGYMDIPNTAAASTNTSACSYGTNNNYILAKNIIIQAQYFGFEDFINYVKMKSVLNCMNSNVFQLYNNDTIAGKRNVDSMRMFTDQQPEELEEEEEEEEDGQNGKDEQTKIIQAFDNKYETLMDAFDDECLPYTYFEQYNNQMLIQVGNNQYTINKTKLLKSCHSIKQMMESSTMTTFSYTNKCTHAHNK